MPAARSGSDELGTLLELWSGNFPTFSEDCLKVLDKSGRIVPFLLNDAQHLCHHLVEAQRAEYGWVRVLILKGRQMGLSTYISGRFTWKYSTHLGTAICILSHESKATKNLGKMAVRYYEYLPKEIQYQLIKCNFEEIQFGDGSECSYILATAGTANTGRGGTINHFHGSEVAFWPHAELHVSGVLQSVPTLPGTEIIFESTANGPRGRFYNAWKKASKGIQWPITKAAWLAFLQDPPALFRMVAGHEAEGEGGTGMPAFLPVFLPWFLDRQYQLPLPDAFRLSDVREGDMVSETDYKSTYGLTDEQMLWRRAKIEELEDVWKFAQEYPATPMEAFQSSIEGPVISRAYYLRARTHRIPDVDLVDAPVILGVDPARGGESWHDKAAMACRQGRKLRWVTARPGMAPARLVAWIEQEAIAVGAHLICIDAAAAGGGEQIVDLLRGTAWGRKVEAVVSGESAYNVDRAATRRDEMWRHMKEWFEDPHVRVDVPDDDDLQAQLQVLLFEYDVHERFVLESKRQARKRLRDLGMNSPDRADAVALTFAAPSVTVRPSAQTVAGEIGFDPLAISSASVEMDW